MNITRNRILSLLLTLCLLFALVSCTAPQDDTQSPDSTADDFYTPGEFGTPTGPIKNVIFIIGDGMGKNHITAGALDRGERYGFESWQTVDVNTSSIDDETDELGVTDSAASATALATGVLTHNGYLGKNTSGEDLPTIMDVARACGKATGIVTTDYLYGATPSGFSAHSDSRTDNKAIIETQTRSGVNFLAGLDSIIYSQSLYKKLIENSPYYRTSTLSDPEIMNKEQVMLTLNIENEEADSVSLSDATATALDYLERDEDGFFLMIEQAYVDKCSHDNDTAGMIARMHSLADTVETVMEWVGDRDDTVVLISADHETGGFMISETEDLGRTYNGTAGSFYYAWTSTDHTATYVALYVYGTQESYEEYETFTGENIKNTDIFTLTKRLVTRGE